VRRIERQLDKEQQRSKRGLLWSAPSGHDDAQEEVEAMAANMLFDFGNTRTNNEIQPTK